MSATPSTVDILGAHLEAALAGVHTCMPGEVIRVHAGPHKRQFVDVQPSLQRRVYDEDSGGMVHESLPVVPMVPVAYPQGGGFFISMPLAVGDIVTLVFAERSLDQWLQVARKGARTAVAPGDVGTHTLEGAIALPCGPAPRPELLEGVDDVDLVVGGPAGILLRATPLGDIQLAEGTVPVALATASAGEFARIQADLTRLITAIKAGFLVCQQKPGALLEPVPAFEAAVTTAVVPSSPASVAATKVRAK